MLPFRMFVYTEPRSAASHSLISDPSQLASSIPFRINTCKSVSKQTTLTPFRMNTYEKHRGEGVLLLTKPPMRMLILSERSESKDFICIPDEGICPEKHRAFCAPRMGLRGDEGSLFKSEKGFLSRAEAEPNQIPTESAKSCVPSSSGCCTTSAAPSSRRFPTVPETAASTARAIAAPCADTAAIRGTSYEPL
jgi:hypothetical protein